MRHSTHDTAWEVMERYRASMSSTSTSSRPNASVCAQPKPNREQSTHCATGLSHTQPIHIVKRKHSKRAGGEHTGSDAAWSSTTEEGPAAERDGPCDRHA